MKLIRSLLYLGLLGLFSYYTGEALPRQHIHENRAWYRSFRWENGGAFYDVFQIKKWKSKMIDMSKIMKRSKIRKEIIGTVTAEYVTALIKETCVAEVSHWFLCVASAWVYHFWGNWIGGLIWILFAVGNLPFIMIQRYNRPNLRRLRDKLAVREQKIREREMLCD